MEESAKARHVADVGDLIGYALQAQFDVVVEPPLPRGCAHRADGWEAAFDHPIDLVPAGRVRPLLDRHHRDY